MTRSGKIYTSRRTGLGLITGIYVLALVLGLIIYLSIDTEVHFLWRLFWADFGATVCVWLAGALLRNSSVYDPYWSVAPPVMFTLLTLATGNYSLPVILLLVGVLVWGVRLTVNWVYTFQNLSIQDWRYDKYKAQFPYLWQLVNFGGINLMPTIIVFLAMIPGFYLIQAPSAVHANVCTWIGFLICLDAALLQGLADRQMHRFRAEFPGRVCNVGLWNVSRHPNYLGEILMWWGVFVIYISTTGGEQVWTALGALVNTLLFVFISIPLMEKRQLKTKPQYVDYQQKTGRLLPKLKLCKRNQPGV